MLPRSKPIICKSCGHETGYTWQGLSMFVIPVGGLCCKNCKAVFLEKRQTILSTSSVT